MLDPNFTRRDWFGAVSAIGLGATMSTADEPTLSKDTPRPIAVTNADLGTLFADVEKIAAMNRYGYSFRSGRFRTFEAFQTAARQKIHEILLYDPLPVDPKPEVLERVERNDHFREKVLFSTAPHFRVPAYVLLPKKGKGPFPAIVDLHSHGGMFVFGKEKVLDLGTNHPIMIEYHQRNYDSRPTATALVRRGYVVITIDAFMFGERRILMDTDLKQGWDRSTYSADLVRQLNQVCRSKESTLAKSMIFAGATWPGVIFRDDLRTVDYLVTRPEVDPKRIGCVGISMGGYRSMFLAALDDRIKAACVTGFMSTTGSMLRAHIDTHSWVHFLPGLHRYLDWPDVVSLAAPRALMVQQCSQDRLFTLQGMKDSLTQIGEVYEKIGKKEQFAGRFYNVPHQFTKAMQEEAFDWFDAQLGNGMK